MAAKGTRTGLCPTPGVVRMPKAEPTERLNRVSQAHTEIPDKGSIIPNILKNHRFPIRSGKTVEEV
jgi:hypothetical protein